MIPIRQPYRSPGFNAVGRSSQAGRCGDTKPASRPKTGSRTSLPSTTVQSRPCSLGFRAERRVRPSPARTLVSGLPALYALAPSHTAGKERRGMTASPPRKATALKEAMTKSQTIASLSESTGLPRKDVAAVLDELGLLIERHIGKRAVGTFTLPGLLRIARARKPARKARTMISPRTGEEIRVPAKPASTTVKVRPLAGLRRMVE